MKKTKFSVEIEIDPGWMNGKPKELFWADLTATMHLALVEALYGKVWSGGKMVPDNFNKVTISCDESPIAGVRF